jgi:hypothetical protein
VRVTPQCDTINSLAICDELGFQAYPSVTFNNENYVVVWTDLRFGNYYRVVASRVTPEGAVIDTGHCIGSNANRHEFHPDIAFDGNRCLVVWYHYSTQPYGIYGRFINSAARPEGSIITISSQFTNYNANPRVEFDGSNYLIAWANNGFGFGSLYGQLVTSQGQLIGNMITITSGSGGRHYHELIFDGDSYLAVWAQGADGIYGQRIGTSGALIDTSFRIVESTTYARKFPGIAARNSNYLVVWSEMRDSTYDIYGNVDLTIGINEEKSVANLNNDYGPTIIRGPLLLPEDKQCRVFDITGRIVAPQHIKPGIYFLQIDGKIKHKIVKVK